MPQPVTTAELLLQEVVVLLTEIRDLLQDTPPPAEPTDQPSAIAEPVRPAPAKKRAPRRQPTH